MGLLGMGAQDSHLDFQFHTVPELCRINAARGLVLL